MQIMELLQLKAPQWRRICFYQFCGPSAFAVPGYSLKPIHTIGAVLCEFRLGPLSRQTLTWRDPKVPKCLLGRQIPPVFPVTERKLQTS